MAENCIISKPENRETFAEKAAVYFAARDAARAADKRDAARESAIKRRAGTFVFDGEEIHSLAQLQTHRPREPMGAAALADSIEKIRSGNEKARAEYPEKIDVYARAHTKARAHFKALDAELASAGLKSDPDLDGRWGEVEALELDAISQTFSGAECCLAFCDFLADYFNTQGFNDSLIGPHIADRLIELRMFIAGVIRRREAE